MSAKAASLPAMCSAKATLASLPDWMMMPRNRSSTLTSVPSWMNMREPGVRQALTLTGTWSARAMRPPSISPAATKPVITLVRLAGGIGSRLLRSAITLPVSASMSRYDSDDRLGGAGMTVAPCRIGEAISNAAKTTGNRNGMVSLLYSVIRCGCAE